MVKYADDNHDIVFNDIEYSVPTVHKAANVSAQFRLGYTHMRVLCEAIKSLVKT